eukprot:TRINITY_DN9509_c0_g1_i1.p2 TRINITY_DN9509_c0_g1~~TRINITY_DN9509_c0_g1_i1.p2  ORF type:complete len:134 (-),score=15.44 TRINITY_DN9509_c0_g1_i1:412-813(-)
MIGVISAFAIALWLVIATSMTSSSAEPPAPLEMQPEPVPTSGIDFDNLIELSPRIKVTVVGDSVLVNQKSGDKYVKVQLEERIRGVEVNGRARRTMLLGISVLADIRLGGNLARAFARHLRLFTFVYRCVCLP